VFDSLEQSVAGPESARDDDVSLRGRAALEAYVQDVLFNPANRDGSRFRGELLAWRDPGARDSFRRELLAAATSWSPEAVGWEKREVAGAISFSGRMGELKATLTFARGAEPRIDLDLE
jgi:hypothetical protein